MPCAMKPKWGAIELLGNKNYYCIYVFFPRLGGARSRSPQLFPNWPLGGSPKMLRSELRVLLPPVPSPPPPPPAPSRGIIKNRLIPKLKKFRQQRVRWERSGEWVKPLLAACTL